MMLMNYKQFGAAGLINISQWNRMRMERSAQVMFKAFQVLYATELFLNKIYS